MFTMILMKNVTVIFLLSLRLQNNCGDTTLQNIRDAIKAANDWAQAQTDAGAE